MAKKIFNNLNEKFFMIKKLFLILCPSVHLCVHLSIYNIYINTPSSQRSKESRPKADILRVIIEIIGDSKAAFIYFQCQFNGSSSWILTLTYLEPPRNSSFYTQVTTTTHRQKEVGGGVVKLEKLCKHTFLSAIKGCGLYQQWDQ